MRKIFFLFFLFFGCAVKKIPLKEAVPSPTEVFPDKSKVPTEKAREIEKVLWSVFEKAKKSPTMDAFGISTMNEAIFLIDEGKFSASFIGEAILMEGVWENYCRESYFWKFKLWCVDIAGYLREPALIEIIENVVLDENEKTEVRIRAVRTLKERRQHHSLRHLFTEVKNSQVKEEIARLILF